MGDYFLTSERSKIGQNPYIWGPRLEKEAELEAPPGVLFSILGLLKGPHP